MPQVSQYIHPQQMMSHLGRAHSDVNNLASFITLTEA